LVKVQVEHAAIFDVPANPTVGRISDSKPSRGNLRPAP
jgi:hypothetical protein